MASSSIEWTELTWNPTTGCDKISAGFKFGYADTVTRCLFSDAYPNRYKRINFTSITIRA